MAKEWPIQFDPQHKVEMQGVKWGDIYDMHSLVMRTESVIAEKIGVDPLNPQDRNVNAAIFAWQFAQPSLKGSAREKLRNGFNRTNQVVDQNMDAEEALMINGALAKLSSYPLDPAILKIVFVPRYMRIRQGFLTAYGITQDQYSKFSDVKTLLLEAAYVRESEGPGRDENMRNPEGKQMSESYIFNNPEATHFGWAVAAEITERLPSRQELLAVA